MMPWSTSTSEQKFFDIYDDNIICSAKKTPESMSSTVNQIHHNLKFTLTTYDKNDVVFSDMNVDMDKN